MLIGSVERAGKWIPAFAGMTQGGASRLFRRAALLLILALAALPARAEDLATVVSELGGASFAAKEKAIVALGKLGDPLAVPILQALSDDRLRRAPDGRVVLVARVAGTTKLLDAASGRELTDVAPDSLERIIVNNRLRGLIEAALGTLTLFSPDRDARLAAAQNVLKHPSPDKVALLDKAMAAEQDAEIHASMQLGLFAVHLFAGSRDEQLAAIRALAGTTLEVTGWLVAELIERRRITSRDVAWVSTVTGTALFSRRAVLSRTEGSA